MARVFGDKELEYIHQVFESKRLGWVPDGMVTKLDEAFAQFTGAKYGICRNSAMTGLAQAVAISGAGCGDEVLCDPLVHFGGVAALSFNCVPKFVDVKYDTYLMDPAEVEKAITKDTKALIVTNLWGLCAELDEIAALCREHDLFMIEDCAHVIGAAWKGKHSGTYGDMSFHFTERPAPAFDVFRQSTAYHKDDCPVRCPFYKGSYRVEDAELPVAADILNRVMTMGCIEVPVAVAERNAESLGRVIARMES